MRKTYGFCYKGSKNKLAERIVDFLPGAENFYDLFCGGCAITHRAMEISKYKNYVINDINPLCPQLFVDAIKGKYKDERRWVSREEFEKQKSTDPFVAFLWSFGNNGRDYLYAKDIEAGKKAWHEAIFFDNYDDFKNMYGIDLSSIKNIEGIRDKYLKTKEIIRSYKSSSKSPTTPIIERLESLERLGKLKSLENIGDLERTEESSSASMCCNRNGSFSAPSELSRLGASKLEALERIEQLQSLIVLNQLQRIEQLQSFSKSYDEIEIKPHSVIYCDIPYENTNAYGKKKDNMGFDYKKFYNWCSKQTEPLFISSYSMPLDQFTCVAEFKHRCTLAATANNSVNEKIFVPNHQIQMIKTLLH